MHESKPVKEIKLPSHTARAMRTATQYVNGLASAAKSAQQALDAAATVHQQYTFAIIGAAGFNPDDFVNYGLVEQDGETYLRAKE